MTPTGPPAAERSIWYREDTETERDLEYIEREFRAGFELVEKIDRPAVSIFGSARAHSDERYYRLAGDTAAGFAREGFAVVTGGGPGIMEAANKGCREAGGLSVGLGIVLPKEQRMNDWCDLSYTFKHFYARKVCFVKAAEGFITFPGGFGTNDELFEALLLIQTAKIRHFPVVLFGSDHWEPLVAWIRDTLVADALISPEDFELFAVTDDPDAAVRAVVDCYRGDCGHA